MRAAAGGPGRRHCSELATSPIGYGIPDFASGAFNDAGAARGAAAARSRRRSAASSRASCRCACSWSTRANALEPTLRLRIEAVLHADPAPEPVAFDTLVDPTTTTSWCGRQCGVTRVATLPLAGIRHAGRRRCAKPDRRCLTPCCPITTASSTRSAGWPPSSPTPIRRSPAGCACRPMRWTTRMSRACWKASPSSPRACITGSTTNSRN